LIICEVLVEKGAKENQRGTKNPEV
jgi:hypothetical protein